MKFLALSGSARRLSTNSHLLHALAAVAPAGITVEVFSGVGDLPVFSADREGEHTPAAVLALATAIDRADGLIVCSPEYVRSLPGGLKNAIDWLVSRDTLVAKPVVLAHASHRGDDMLENLRVVLATVSTRFTEALFLRLPVMGATPEEIQAAMAEPAQREEAEAFLRAFAGYCASGV